MLYSLCGSFLVIIFHRRANIYFVLLSEFFQHRTLALWIELIAHSRNRSRFNSSGSSVISASTTTATKKFMGSKNKKFGKDDAIELLLYAMISITLLTTDVTNVLHF